MKNSSSEEIVEVDGANVVAEPEIDDGAQKMNMSNEEDSVQAEKTVSSAETGNIFGECGFDEEMEDQLQETGLANGAEKMSKLNEEDMGEKSHAEENDSSTSTDSALDMEIEDQPQETGLATSGNVQSSSSDEFENNDVLIDAEIVITITEVESPDEVDSQDEVESQDEVKSQDEVQDKISADEDVLIEENVGETTFEMSASAADSSDRDNNEIEIDKEVGQASYADENVGDEQESKEDTSQGHLE